MPESICSCGSYLNVVGRPDPSCEASQHEEMLPDGRTFVPWEPPDLPDVVRAQDRRTLWPHLSAALCGAEGPALKAEK